MPKKKGKLKNGVESDGEDSLVVYLLVRTDLRMGKGKIGVQCGHAIENLIISSGNGGSSEVWRRYRRECGSRKICYGVTEPGLWSVVDFCQENRIPCVEVSDAGLTQVASGTVTCAAIGPIDPVSSKLNVELRGLKLLG